MPIDLILDECLERLKQGDSMERCLADFPQEAEALRLLLETAAGISTVPVQHSTTAVYQKGRDRMFAVVALEFPQQAVSESVLSRYSRQILTWITGKENIDMKLVKRFAIAVALVLVLITGLGTTAVSASSALPGDILYPIKTSVQNAQLMLTWNTEAHQSLKHHFQEEYRNDVRMLVQNRRQAQVRFLGTLDSAQDSLWMIGGLSVSIDAATVISGNPQPGDVILVEAAVQKDGSILASSVSLNSSLHHSEEPLLTPEHTPAHTAEPEHQGQDPEHAAPTELHEPEHDIQKGSGTVLPMHHDDPQSATLAPIPTAYPTERVRHDDGHDGGHEGGHDGGDH